MKKLAFILPLSLVAILSAGLLSRAVRADENLVANGDFHNGLEGWKVSGGARVQAEVVKATAAPSNQFLRATITRSEGDHPWSVTVNSPLKSALAQGTPITLRFSARSTQVPLISAFVEQAKAPYEQSLSKSFKLSQQWQRYELTGAAKSDFETGGARVTFHLAHAMGTVDIADIRVTAAKVQAAVTGGASTNIIEPQLSTLAFSSRIPEARKQTVAVNDQSFKEALRVEVPSKPEVPWGVQVSTPTVEPVSKDEALTARFWARSVTEEKARVILVFQLARAPFAKSTWTEISPGPQWQEFTVNFKALSDYATGEARVDILFGAQAQTVEIADVRVTSDAVRVGKVLDGPRAMPGQPVSLLAQRSLAVPLNATWTTSGVSSIGTAPSPSNQTSSTALRFNVKKIVAREPWRVQFGQKSAAPVRRGDMVYVKAWLRGQERITVALSLQEAQPPHRNFFWQPVRLTPEWKEYRFVGESPGDYRSGETQFQLFMGYAPGIIEISGVSVENFGAAPRSLFKETIDPFGGAPNPDSWRAPALARIEKIRKADLKVRVIDAKGKPVSGARVQIKQTASSFRWGMAGPAERLLDNRDEDNLRYQAEIKRLFNSWTFENDLKWQRTEQETLNAQARAEKALPWLRANGFHTVHGHVLAWGGWQFLPKDFDKLPNDEIKRALRARVFQAVGRFKGKMETWDAVNEAVTQKDLWERIGWETMADVYRWAREADPKVKLAYNDFNMSHEADGGTHRKIAMQRIKSLIELGAPLDIIGDQAHYGWPLTPPGRVLEIWNDLAKFGKPIEITELDIGMWNNDAQAEYMRDILIAAFSHPNIIGVTQWSFWEGNHWRAKDGAHIVNRNWTPRPAMRVYEDLVLKQWRTRKSGATNAKGEFSTRGFHGTYEITVTYGGKVTLVLLLPAGGKTATVKIP